MCTFIEPTRWLAARNYTHSVPRNMSYVADPAL